MERIEMIVKLTHGWHGKVTEELRELYDEYYDKFDDFPDTYAGILYDCMTYEEFIAYIRECIDKNLEIPDIVD